MNITQEKIDDLNSLVRIKITPEDYNKEVESTIKKYKKSASMPGFRPGHVPDGMIRKMYGKAVLADELNKIVSNSLNSYIAENKLQVLGDPMPKDNDSFKNNFDEATDFEFLFELGLAPNVNVDLKSLSAVPAYEIEVDEKRIEDYIDDIRRRYGKFSNPEVADEHSILYGNFEELNDNGEVKEGGIKSQAVLAIDLVKDAKVRKQLVGIKKEEVVTFSPSAAMQNDSEVAHMLRIEKEQAQQLKSNFNYKIDSINHVERAELNQEFFDKIFGPGTVTSEADMREKVKERIAGMFKNETEHKLKHDLEDELLHKLKLNLPDAFLKRWLKTATEKPITDEQLEQEYPSYSREMKLKLIENQIYREQNMNVSKEEIESFSKGWVLNQFAQYGSQMNFPEETINDMTKRYMEKQENVNRAVESIKERKVFEYMNQIISKDVKKVKYDEFVEIVKNHKH